MTSELRLALRSLRRRPGFTLLVIGSLSLGIGAATGTFTLLQQFVLRPLPVRDQDELAVVWGNHRTRGFDRFPFSYNAYERIREETRSLDGIAATEAWGTVERLIEEEDSWRRVRWGRVVGDFFGVLGVDPVLGRTLRPEDDVPGAEPVVVVSHRFWSRRWGGDPSAIGSRLVTDGRPFTVVGVLPAGFDYPPGAEIWSPVRVHYPNWADEPPQLELHQVARLADAVTVSDVAQEVEQTLRADPALTPIYRDVEAVVQPFSRVVLGDLRPTIFTLFAGALLVLIVACFNVANLIFVRAAEQDTDMSIRRALGAGFPQLIRGTLPEGLLLGTIAGAAGALLALTAVRLVIPLAPVGLPRLEDVGVGLPTYLFATLLTACLVALLILLPAVRARTSDLSAHLRASRPIHGRSGPRRSGLMLGQSALALWAVAAAALMYRTLDNLEGLDLGFEETGVFLVELDHDYGHFEVPPDYPARLEAVTRRLESYPAISAATPALAPPLSGNAGFDVVPTLEAGDSRSSEDLPYLSLEVANPGYFETLALPLLRGRPLGEQDASGALPVVVVNEAAARALWPGAEPLGKRLNFPFPGFEDVWWTVIGIAGNSRYRSLIDVRPAVYFPLQQFTVLAPRYLLVRAHDMPDLPQRVRSAFAEVDPSVRFVGAVPLSRHLGAPLARPRLALTVLGLFAVVVLILSGIGVFGVMAASVAGRIAEMGVRKAMGARPGDVARLVIRQGMSVAFLGASLGLAFALATGRFLEALLFEVTASDPLSLAAATTLVLTVAGTACALPAIRAARTDPTEALRHE